MKFTTTCNKTYRPGIGYIPKLWIEVPEGKDHKFAIREYFHNHIYHYDYDEGDDETHDFVFDDGKAFRLEYSYWSEWYHEDEDENGLKSEYHFYEIPLDEANVPEKKQDRNWI